MRKESLFIIILFFSILVNAQNPLSPEFKYHVRITTNDSVVNLNNSAFSSFSETGFELTRYNREYFLRNHQHKTLKFDFDDIKTISYRNRKSMIPSIATGSVIGAIMGGFTGSKIKPKSSKSVQGIFLEWDVPVRSGAREGIFIGAGLGGAIGALAASIPITIPLADDRIFERTRKLQKLTHKKKIK